MIKKVIFKILLILILCTNYSYGEFYSYSNADLLEAEKLIQQDKAKAIEKISKLECAIYTNSFAKRFSLPELAEPMPENTGILAMEFRFEKGIANSPVSEYFFAKLLLYIDNQKMQVQMPGDLEESNWDMSNVHMHFFAHPREQFMKWTKTDRLHFGRHTRGSMLILLSNNAYQDNTKGKMSSCIIDEHMKNIVLGIDYVKLKIYLGLKPEAKNNTLLWLKKIDSTDYTIPHKEISLKDFYMVELSNRFYNKIYMLFQLMKKSQR